MTNGAGGPLEAVRAWRRFANNVSFMFRGESRTWAQHVTVGGGYIDEDALIKPYVFPRFAEELLGFAVGQNLAAEHAEAGQKPDFTPADAVTHDFVFEIKSTRAGVGIADFDPQIQNLGAASVGDKTIGDAFVPALAAFERGLRAGDDLATTVTRAREAAEEGMRATIPMQARKGRASYLGPRSVGHQDPGATSTALLFSALEQAAGSPDGGPMEPR